VKTLKNTFFLLVLLTTTASAIPAIEIEKDDKPTTTQMRDVLLNGSLRGRAEAAQRLMALATPEAMAALFDGMADTYAAYIAADAVLQRAIQKPEGLAPLLLPGLKHKDYRTRMLTAYMLGKTGDKAASSELSVALSDESRDVRLYSAQALRKAGDKNAVPALIKALSDQYGLVRLQAAAALGQIGDSSAIPGLIKALDDPDAAINAARALGKLGGKEAEDALVAKIKAPDPAVSWAVIEALGACSKTPAVSQQLKDLAKTTTNERTKKTCEDASAAIDGRAEK
jgi:HEAT repeat protein